MLYSSNNLATLHSNEDTLLCAIDFLRASGLCEGCEYPVLC